MTLPIGTPVGAYEVVAAIGAGGMGEVYRARDTRLKRDVALKILPDAVATDPDRLARFQREAEVLASLNHPNIAGIYGLEESDGIRALVMELVDGETLADRIARGAIPLDEALPIARQIAEALEAAHEQGIIHRDLKPANIKVKPDGTVKVLDFGLAKLAESPIGTTGNAAGLSMSPTITSPALVSGVGVLLGTAAYMSPEQAKGRAADERSDIWAFGCVLFEMLTGRRAFDGEDVASVLARAIERDPDWTALPSTVPPRVRELLQLCLDKKPKQRRQSAGDLRIDIDQAGNTPPATSTRTASHRRNRVWVSAVSAAAIAALLTAAGAWWALRSPAPRVVRTAITTNGATAIRLGRSGPDLTITPDGSRIVYVGNGGTQLFVRGLDQLAPIAIVTTTSGSGLGSPFVSPDGQSVGFFEGSTLKKVAITGGPVVTLAMLSRLPRGATWGASDTIVFATAEGNSGLQRISAAGGPVTTLTKPDRNRGEVSHQWPEFLPGKSAVLFTISRAGGADNAEIAVFDLTTGAVKALLRGSANGHYISSGHLVYAAGGVLRVVRFDLDAIEVRGTPVPLVDQVFVYSGFAVIPDMAVASNGTLAYVPSEGAPRTPLRNLVWVDQHGREQAIAAPARPYTSPRISPDGRRVAVNIGDGQNDLWIYDFARGTLERLTFDPLQDSDPVWSPDGTRIAYYATGRDGGEGIFVRATDGSGEVTRLTTGPQRPKSGSPDGKFVAFMTTGAGSGTQDIGLIAVDGKTPPKLLIATPAREDTPRVSPDGRWLAYETDETGTDEIFVRPFPAVDTGRWRVSTGGGLDPMWARDGKHLYYRSGQTILTVAVKDSSPESWGLPESPFHLDGPYLLQQGQTELDVSPDGGRFLMIKPAEAAQPSSTGQIIVVQNWHEELKRLVPTK